MDPGVWPFGGIELTEKVPFAVNETRVIWPLSPQVTVDIRFSGGLVQRRHVEILGKYLALLKEALEVPDAPEDAPNSTAAD
jgi:hypothetical protein